MGATTIYEIAEEVGVSAATVSRVLNNKTGVKKETRAKVLASVKKHNFSLNETARGLVSQSTKMIGILLADLRTTHHTDGIYYIQQELDRLGYCCLIMNTGYEEAEKVRYLKILKQRRVEAVVLIGSNFASPAVKDAISEYLPNIPIFITNGFIELPNVYGVIADDRQGVEACVRFLKGKGRKRVAFINGRHTPSNEMKLLGFQDGAGDDALVFENGFDYNSTEEIITTMLKEHPEVDALICVDDPVALMVLRILKDRNVQVPQQISVMGINNSSSAELSIPRLSSLDNMLLDVNLTTARSLVDVIQGRYVPKKIMVYSKIVERETT